MSTRLWAGLAATTLLLVALAFAFGTSGVSAAGEQPAGPDRYAIVSENYISYAWWLTSWSTNKIVCTIDVDHEGVPTAGEIYDACGETLYESWAKTTPCSASVSDPGTCGGYYLQFYKSEPAQRDVGVKLPMPVVWVTLDGCAPHNSTFRCEGMPTLILTGEEPLAGEQITGLAGRVDGTYFTCSATCQVDLGPTGADGVLIEFWANSSYGDTSELFTARVRVAASDDPADDHWYVDVLSDQWRGLPLAGCSQVWDTFPTLGGVSGWLSTPQRPEDLATSVPYEYLAAKLIEHGIVDASSCENGGLVGEGLVNACGMEAARAAVDEWQNRFDNLIFATAQETGIPAQLLKNIFSRESQFWPGVMTGHPEAGLGQMTENGADVTLLWNPSFYEQFCPLVLDQSVCDSKVYPDLETNWDYLELSEEERSLLRTSLVSSVNAFCPDCPLGVDLDRADYSVSVFAETLLSSCAQTGKVVELNYGYADPPPTYEDMWRFTLVDYNAGAGCLGLAINETNEQNQDLTWENVSFHLTPACEGARDYVNDITKMP